MSTRHRAAPRLRIDGALELELDDVADHGGAGAAQLLGDVEGGHRGDEHHGDAGDDAGHGQGQDDAGGRPAGCSQPRSCCGLNEPGVELA